MVEHKETELVRANRLLLGLSFTLLVLLGPSFILGYFSGYRSARADGPLTASASLPAALPQSAAPAKTKTLPRQSTQTERQKRTGWAGTKESTPAARTNQTAAGRIYLQLVAAPQNDSGAIIDELRNNGLPAVAAEVPEKPGLYRVLVGPLDEGDLDRTRAELESRGFPGDSAIRRTF